MIISTKKKVERDKSCGPCLRPGKSVISSQVIKEQEKVTEKKHPEIHN